MLCVLVPMQSLKRKFWQTMPECFFAHLGGCEGRLVKAHLVPKQTLKREFRTRSVFADIPVIGEDAVDRAVWDTRCWRWMCGGPTGIGGHHGAYDAYQIRLSCSGCKGMGQTSSETGEPIPRGSLRADIAECAYCDGRGTAWPEDFLEFLREYDIEWMADKYATESTRRA
jgi:hypothetical protein